MPQEFYYTVFLVLTNLKKNRMILFAANDGSRFDLYKVCTSSSICNRSFSLFVILRLKSVCLSYMLAFQCRSFPPLFTWHFIELKSMATRVQETSSCWQSPDEPPSLYLRSILSLEDSGEVYIKPIQTQWYCYDIENALSLLSPLSFQLSDTVMRNLSTNARSGLTSDMVCRWECIFFLEPLLLSLRASWVHFHPTKRTPHYLA